jgi:DNA-directed RNA polymerase subunit RPC12/RpoP
MIRTSEIDGNNNILHTETCMACGHKCNQVYVVDNGVIKDYEEIGLQFIKTANSVVVGKVNQEQETQTVYKCLNCGVLQAEVIK